jgi:hypothetical protein
MCSNPLTPIDYLYSFEHLKVLRQTCIPIDNSPFLVISGLPCNPSSSHNTWFQTLEDLPEPNVQYSMYIYLTVCYLMTKRRYQTLCIYKAERSAMSLSFHRVREFVIGYQNPVAGQHKLKPHISPS